MKKTKPIAWACHIEDARYSVSDGMVTHSVGEDQLRVGDGMIMSMYKVARDYADGSADGVTSRSKN